MKEDIIDNKQINKISVFEQIKNKEWSFSGSHSYVFRSKDWVIQKSRSQD